VRQWDLLGLLFYPFLIQDLVLKGAITMIHDPAHCFLGRNPPKHYAKTLKLANYLAPVLPVPPPSKVWSTAIRTWGMMLNDREGCCVISGGGHHHLLRTTLAGKSDMPTDAQVQEAYVAITGMEGAAYDPATGDNDNGCALEDALNYFRKSGQVGAYASVNPTNLDHLRFTINAFEGAFVGVSLPISAQNQDVWDVSDPSLTGDAELGGWGDHCILLTDYSPDGFTCVTWGQTKKLTLAWWLAYANPAVGGEAYAIITPELLDGTGNVPSGIDMVALQADLAAL
jgi:hypothetical protein